MYSGAAGCSRVCGAGLAIGDGVSGHTDAMVKPRRLWRLVGRDGLEGMVLPEELAARILAETVRRRASLRDVAVGFFSRNPELDYMKPIVRVSTLGVARNYLLLDRVLVSLGYGPPSHSQRWMLARVLVYEALSGKLKPTRAWKPAGKAGLDPDKLLELRGADPREFVKGLSGLDKLSVLYSFPRWMLEELLEVRIPDLPKLLEALNSDPVRWIRIRLGVDRKWLVERLQEQGVVIEPDRDLPDVARIVKGASEATRARECQEGLYTIQDKASTLVGWVASPRDRVVADPTAGAAIKASHMAWLGARYVVAGDVKPQRLQEAKRTLSRLGLGHIVDLAVGDARMPYWRKLDVVIVDRHALILVGCSTSPRSSSGPPEATSTTTAACSSGY